MAEKLSGLVYYPDTRPGILRKKRGRGFTYFAQDGTRIDCVKERERLARMAVPPAYENVWLSPKANGHLLATGRDAKGRKQYRYHPEWAAWRAHQKYDQLPDLAHRLPSLRRWISSHLKGEVARRETAVAAVLALIDRVAMRPGHPDYTKLNGSYGAATLRARHVVVAGDHVCLNYRAKGGQQVEKSLRGAGLARALHRYADLPGGELFTYRAQNGDQLPVRTEHVSAVLRQLCGPAASPKALRTWAGTHAAFCALNTDDPVTIKTVTEAAAERLHNTPSIARSSYIHPKVIGLAGSGDEKRRVRLAQLDWSPLDMYRAGERALLEILTDG